MMTTQSKLEDTVTGQQELNDLDLLPAHCKGVEFLSRHQGDVVGPYVVQGNLRPKWDGNTFSEVRPQVSWRAKGLFHSDHLQREMPEGEGTYIHLKTFSAGELTFVRDRSDAAIGTIPGVGAEMNVYETWDPSMFSESMTNISREERGSITGAIVDDNCLGESKKSD